MEGATLPIPGRRYVFTDFVGASFEATLLTLEAKDGGVRLTFDDHRPFSTNLPLTAEEVAASESADRG